MTRVARPKDHEPIRVVKVQSGVRYRATLDVAQPGAPRRQVTTTWPTLTAAREYVTETRARIKAGNFTAPTKVTLTEVFGEWIASRRDIREVSREGYRTAIAPILDRIGSRQVQSIGRRDVEAVVTALESEPGKRGKPLSHRSQQYALTALRMTLEFAVSAQILQHNPAQGVRVRRKTADDKTETAVWTPVQLRQFVGHVDADGDDWARVAFRLAACGLRRSETLGLSWDSVDLDAGTVHVQASRVRTGGNGTSLDSVKSAASDRVVAVEAIWPGTSAALKALRAQQARDRLAAGSAWEDTGLVIVDAIGSPVHPETYALRWRGLVKDSGLPQIRAHALRHSVALVLHRAGVAPADAASMLGHEVATHLAYYVPRTEKGAATAASALGQALAAAE